MRKAFKTVKQLGGSRDKRHGTVGAYGYWGCRCGLCVEAARASRAESRKRKLDNLQPGDHGKTHTYNIGCRCTACRAAGRRPTRPAPKKMPILEMSTLA